MTWQAELELLRTRYESSGMSARSGWGNVPALLVVDLSVGFTDPASPLGGSVDGAVCAASALVAAARAADAKVIFTTVGYRADMSDAGIWPLKLPSQHLLIEGSRWVDLDPRLTALPGELLVKQQASAFMGTSLADELRRAGVDTVVIAGVTTSGCVRASVVDACGHGFRTIVVREAVADRHPLVHEVSLFDMDAKYADVVALDEAVAAFGP